MKKFWEMLKESGLGKRLDIYVFLLNLVIMPTLVSRFNETVRAAGRGDERASQSLAIIGILLLTLAPVGATLKRWRAHQNKQVADFDDGPAGCLYNPVFYLCLMFVIFSAVSAYFMQITYPRSEPPEQVFLSSLCGGILLCLVHTWLVYRYFSKPEHPPRITFLQSNLSASLGDLLIFANATLFQMFWNLLVDVGFPRVSSIGEALGRVPLLVFIALLLYFPPRVLYLATEEKSGKTWLWMLFANLPTIFRFVIGVNP